MTLWLGAAAAAAPAPCPLAGHPGNVFLEGEVVTLPAPPAESWRCFDYERNLCAEERVFNGLARLGRLPVGYYELAWDGPGAQSNRTSVAVLSPLRSGIPAESPIAIDLALAWFFPRQRMREPVNLCTLAGVNWVRDRLSWPELEPERGQWSRETRYDWAVEAQHQAGLHVLEVNHIAPKWANPNPKRFPTDLRDIYNFEREIARRWRGQVQAFEPWNEADIQVFGGHTGSEMASLQKAAFFALKAGNPEVIACMNVFAIRRASTLADFQANETWPYFDTFNLHHYEPLENYPSLYADFRAVSGGKPMWTTECSVRVNWQGDPVLKELSWSDQMAQAERLTKTYALALHEGVAEVFYFMLPHYSEGQVQYGLLRADLTPRPGYVALAAVGRLLAHARPLGRLQIPNQTARGYVFQAKPDGRNMRVLVAWADSECAIRLPSKAKACFDHLGRPIAAEGLNLKLSRAPVYVLWSGGTRLPVMPPPASARMLQGKPCPLVLQVSMSEADSDIKRSAYRFGDSETRTISLFAYNFSKKPIRGQLAIAVPKRWKAKLPEQISVTPGERKELALELTRSEWLQGKAATIKIIGNFGTAGQAVLAFRLVPN
jgi:hypothetical protein